MKHPPDAAALIYSTGEVAKYLGLSRRAVTKYCEAGKIEASQNKISKRWTIHQKNLVEFMKIHGLAPVPIQSTPVILIVDDEPSISSLIADTLSVLEFPVTIDSTCNGFDALIKIGAVMPALVFLDVRMPGVDGKDILVTLKKGTDTKNIKVIVITGFEEEVEAMLHLGADQAIIKPFTREQILSAARKYITNK